MSEAILLHVQPDTIRQKLTALGATCVIPLRRIQRYIFSHPTLPLDYVCIQYESGKISTYYKDVGQLLEKVEVVIDALEPMKSIYEKCGLQQKSIQEFYKENWYYNGVHLSIERRPALRPFLRIEKGSPEIVKVCLQGLGYTDLYEENNHQLVATQKQIAKKYAGRKQDIHVRYRSTMMQGSIVDIYKRELGISKESFEKIPVISFDNPPIL